MLLSLISDGRAFERAANARLATERDLYLERNPSDPKVAAA